MRRLHAVKEYWINLVVVVVCWDTKKEKKVGEMRRGIVFLFGQQISVLYCGTNLVLHVGDCVGGGGEVEARLAFREIGDETEYRSFVTKKSLRKYVWMEGRGEVD